MSTIFDSMGIDSGIIIIVLLVICALHDWKENTKCL